MSAPVLYPANPDGPLLEDLLEQLISDVRAKQDRARIASDTVGARESALVVTNLEQALLWQIRRSMVRGDQRFQANPDGSFSVVPNPPATRPL